MKKILLPACIITIISFSACEGNGYQYNATNSTTKPFTYPIATDSTKSIFPNIKNTKGTTSNPQIFSSNPVQSGNGNTNLSGATGLNPAHGQPGHRCEIAVGAPLNSPVNPGQPTASATQTLPVLPKTASNASETDKLNPAHGQPGHRCDIAVGAPLNSPVKKDQPATSATQTLPPISSENRPQPVSPATQPFPTLPKSTGNASGTGKLNPAHGQPGHDCTIAVGQPLKS